MRKLTLDECNNIDDVLNENFLFELSENLNDNDTISKDMGWTRKRKWTKKIEIILYY